jgi:hypothetical protein
LAPIAPFFLDWASAWNAFSSSSRLTRSGLAWTLSRERSFDRDLPEAEVGGGEDPDVLALAELGQEPDDLGRLVGRDLPALVAEALPESPDQLLEDGPHRRVVDPVGVEIHGPEALQHLEEEPGLVQLADGVVEVEPLQHLAHVRAEAGDVVPQVRREVRRIGQELVEVVAGGVVEGEARGAAELAARILQLPLEPAFRLQDAGLGRGQDAVEAAEHGERQDDVLVLAALEGVADQIRHTPQEADDLAVVHGGALIRAGSASG